MNLNFSDIVISVDLELAQPSNKIISIGYAIGNIKTHEVLEANDLFVKIDEPLTPFIIQLTGITDELLEEQGTDLLTAYSKLVDAHNRHKSFVNPITWGGGDTTAIFDQVKAASKDNFEWVFGRRWIDAKTVFIAHQMAHGRPFKGGLTTSMRKLGLKFSGTPHRSKDDAINTFVVYCNLLTRIKE